MRTVELLGPFPLTISAIEEQLGSVISAGVIALGDNRSPEQWRIQKIDRSDEHIRARLWANIAGYSLFCYQLCESPEEAYRVHCELFHQQASPRGKHPEPPLRSFVTCPICVSAADEGVA